MWRDLRGKIATKDRRVRMSTKEGKELLPLRALCHLHFSLNHMKCVEIIERVGESA
jgi:hypothetical protein